LLKPLVNPLYVKPCINSVLVLLKVANNDLPAVELRYERLKKEAATLEFQKASSARDSELLNNQIIMMRKTRDSTRLDYEKEMERLRHLQQQRMKQEALVKHFENSNEVYIKIRKTVEEKVISILSNSKMLLKLALSSLTESRRNDPDRYSALIYHNRSSITQSRDYSSNHYYDTASYGQRQYPSQDYTAMILDAAEKLYDKLAIKLRDESISDYGFSRLSSLPLLQPPSDEAKNNNQIYLQEEFITIIGFLKNFL